jgi:hypothetical protein
MGSAAPIIGHFAVAGLEICSAGVVDDRILRPRRTRREDSGGVIVVAEPRASQSPIDSCDRMPHWARRPDNRVCMGPLTRL